MPDMGEDGKITAMDKVKAERPPGVMLGNTAQQVNQTGKGDLRARIADLRSRADALEALYNCLPERLTRHQEDGLAVLLYRNTI